MAKNLLQIVQEVRGRLGQPVPGSVAANTDPGILQCMGLLNEFCEDLIVRQYWQANTREATIIALAQESQGTLDTIFPYGYEGLIPETFYNRTNRLRVTGGVTPSQWALRKAMSFTGPLPAFRIRGNELLFNPPPVAGHHYSVEYFSSYFIQDNSGPTPTYKPYWTKDSDTCTLGDALPMAYLKWAWKAAKGLDYAEEFRKYENLLEVKGLRDVRAEPLTMDGQLPNVGPGIIVQPGSWMQ